MAAGVAEDRCTMKDYSKKSTATLEAMLHILKQVTVDTDLHAAWSRACVAEEVRRELKRREAR